MVVGFGASSYSTQRPTVYNTTQKTAQYVNKCKTAVAFIPTIVTYSLTMLL